MYSISNAEKHETSMYYCTYLRIQLKNSSNHRNRLKLYKIESDRSVEAGKITLQYIFIIKETSYIQR